MTERLTWVECHGYYDPAQAQIGRMIQDAAKWHGWPNCVPMIGLGSGWTLAGYPEIAGYPVWSAWRWEQITAWDDLALKPGCYLWTADGFEAGTGTVQDLIATCRKILAKGVFLQCGHAHREQADPLRAAGFDVQAWASCAQISQAELRASLDELRPSRFVGQIEGQSERDAMAAAVQAGVFSMPWDTVIAGWGDFQAL